MTFHFITLAIGLIFLALAFFFIGRASGIKKEGGDDTSVAPAGALLAYLAAMALVTFAGSYSELRENYIKKYDNKDYVWVSGTKSFVDKNGKTYFYRLDSTLVNKKNITKYHEVQEISQEPQEQEGE